jgi:hypothetical protein
MTALETLYASGGRAVIIGTLALHSVPWAEPIYLCEGFDDITAVTETGQTVTYTAAAIALALPKRDNSGNQSLLFAIDNVTGFAQQMIDQALEARAQISLVMRIYESNSLTAPAEAPYNMKVLSGTMEGATVQLKAGYFDLINLGWPRLKWTLAFAPCLRYI